jgi:hypothetical protein
LARHTAYQPAISLEAMLRDTIDGIERTGSAQPYHADEREEALIAQLMGGEAEVSGMLG